MSLKHKIFGISTAAIGVFFIYTATAFVIPFPTEFITLGIAHLLGGITVTNMKYAFILEWIVGASLLILGIAIYRYSSDGLSIKPKKGK